MDGQNKVSVGDRIVCDPNVCGGKPRIRGSRVTVRDVVSMIAGGETVEGVLAAYPFLEPEDVRAALDYSARAVEDSVLPLAIG